MMDRACFHAAVMRLSTLICATTLAAFPLGAQQAAPPAGAGAALPAPANAEAARTSATVVSAHDRDGAAKLYAKGVKAMDDQDLRLAAQAFSEAMKLDPGNREYPVAADVARQHLLTQLVQEAAKARLAGQYDIARAKLDEALKIDPNNLVVT